jgi:hypothetical protein
MSINNLNNTGNTSTITLPTGSYTTLTNNSTISYVNGGSWADRSHVDDVKDYIDFVLELLDIDLDFDRFVRMSASDKKALIREIKLNKIID